MTLPALLLPVLLLLVESALLAAPCQVISINNNDKKLVYNRSCVERVTEEANYVYVISVIGDFQTGKSFMINMLSGLTGEDVLSVGNSLETETEGVFVPGHLVTINKEGGIGLPRDL